MENDRNKTLRDQFSVRNIEQKIRNNQFESKEQLFEELVNLRNSGVGEVLNNQKMRELLDLYDSMQSKEKTPLDMKNYASVDLESQDLIVSKEADRVLTTLKGTSEFNNEFTQTQNEIIANNKDGMVSADAVFEKMANHQKEEITLIPLIESISRDDIDIEILNKIRFFITNSYINPYSFKVDVKNGIIYNVETNEVFEVRKNENTNQYEVYRENEKIYGKDIENSVEPELVNETEQEEMTYESRLNKPKVRVRKKEDYPHANNAAFTKIGFLLINVVTFGLLVAMAILLYK